MLPREFFLVLEEIFRLGNSASPRLSNVWPRDINITTINRIEVIIANGKGISVFDKEGINESPCQAGFCASRQIHSDLLA